MAVGSFCQVVLAVGCGCVDVVVVADNYGTVVLAAGGASADGADGADGGAAGGASLVVLIKMVIEKKNGRACQGEAAVGVGADAVVGACFGGTIRTTFSAE